MASKVLGQKGQTYWWKDKSGRWHYHKQGAQVPPRTNVTNTSTTKPAATGATASGGRPTTAIATSTASGITRGGTPAPTYTGKVLKTNPPKYVMSDGTTTLTPPPGGRDPGHSGTQVDPGFYKPGSGPAATKPTRVTGPTRDSVANAPAGKPFKAHLGSPDVPANIMQSKQGTGSDSKGKKTMGSPKAAGASKGGSLSFSGSQGGPGSGRNAVDGGQGSRKVYDEAKSRLLNKKKKAYRP